MRTKRSRRFRAAGLLAGLGAAGLAACGGFGCGDTGLGPCGPDLQLYVAIDVAVADFNGDGHPDVVLPVSQGLNDPGQAAVYLHAAAAGKSYLPRGNYPAGVDFPSRVVVADLDADGHPDLILLNSSATTGSVGLLLGNAASPGTFRAGQTFSAPYPSDVAAADLSGDGRADLIIGGDTLMVAMQNPGTPGTFSSPETLVPSPSGVMSIAVADLDGDGTPDVAAANADAVTVLFLEAGANTPVVRATQTVYRFPPPVANAGQNAVAIVDLDGDGRNDLVVVDPVGGVVAVILQSHTVPGAFMPPVTYSLPGHGGLNRLAVADLNGDSRPDLVIAASDAVLVYLQDATHPGSFDPVSTYPAGISANGVAVADVDGDGLPDIVIESGVTASIGSLSPPGVLYQDATRPGRFLSVQDLQIQ
jgi:hypothetical protein